MSALKAGGINITMAGAAFAAFLGFGWCLGMIDGRPGAEISAWLYLWAGVSSLTLAVALATFFIEITDHLESVFTRTPRARGRHAR